MLPLNFQTIARSRGESVSPGLWPSICLCPMLGIQGNTLYNIAGATPAQTWGGATVWGANYLTFTGASNNSYINTGLVYPFPSSGLSVVITASHSATQADTYQNIISSYVGNWSLGYAKATKKYYLEIAKSSGSYYRYNNTAITSDTVVTMIATADYGGTYPDTYLNGVLDNGSTGGTVGTPNSGSAAIFIGMMNATTTNTNWGGSIYNIMVYPFRLTQYQVSLITADPLLPLRRKKQWSMYVPSTGGVFKPYWCQTPTTIGAA